MTKNPNSLLFCFISQHIPAPSDGIDLLLRVEIFCHVGKARLGIRGTVVRQPISGKRPRVRDRWLGASHGTVSRLPSSFNQVGLSGSHL